MSDFTDDDQPADDFDLRERVRVAAEAAEKAGMPCGLYLEHFDAGITPAGEPVLLAQFRVGDLAFTPRVLDPAAEDTNKVVREMEVDARLDDFNRIARQAKEGTGPIADLEGDEDAV